VLDMAVVVLPLVALAPPGLANPTTEFAPKTRIYRSRLWSELVLKGSERDRSVLRDFDGGANI
jgi:hypothetical protein